MKELIINTIPFEYVPSALNESITGGKLLVSGILQRANAKNQNGRIYPKEVLLREVEKYNNNFVKSRRALGELDHAESSVVNLKNVSHNIVEMHWNNDDLVGTLEILQTPNGNILKDLLKAGILIGISSRGLGSVKNDIQEKADIVQDDFDLICFDVVSTPSTQGAFMHEKNLHVNESVDKNKNSNNVIDPVYIKIDDIIRDILTDI